MLKFLSAPRGSLLLIGALMLLTSCTAAVLAGAGVGIEYSLNNVAYKTLNFSIRSVEDATDRALRDLDMQKVDEEGSYPEKRITAVTMDLDIKITLREITSRATRLKVDARKGPVLKDRATAAAVIERVERILEEDT